MNKREIKFRAWDGEKILEHVPVESVTIGTLLEFRGSSLVLMQYTGLKDKNDKEVYEGDIRACYDTAGELVYNEEIKIPQVYQTIWDETNSEVIGNIYENPELLK